MSHTVVNLQQMSDRELVHIAAAIFSPNRRRAEEILQQRAAERANAAAALQQNVNNLTSQVNGLQITNAGLENTVRTLNSAVTDMNRQHTQAVNRLHTQFSEQIEAEGRARREAYQKLEAQHNRDMQATRQQIDDVRRDTTNRVEAVRRETAGQIGAVRRETASQIGEVRRETASQINDVRRDMTSQIGEVRRDTTRQINDMSRSITDNLTGQINQVRERFAREITAVNSSVNAIGSAMTALGNNAGMLVDDARQIQQTALAIINETIRFNNENQHNWLASELTEMRELNQRITNDINSGNTILQAGTIRNNAMDLFRDAVNYRMGVIQAEQEWQLHRENAETHIASVTAMLEQNRTIQIDGLSIDVDYWTCGDLSRIKDQIRELDEVVIQSPAATTEELDAAAALMEQYRQEIEQACLFAAQAHRMSRDRREILEIACEELEQRLGTVNTQWLEYFGNDERLGCRAYINSASGERFVLTAEPQVEGENIGNMYRFDILGYGEDIHSEEDADQLSNAITKTLEDIEDVEFVGDAVCSNRERVVADQGQTNETAWRQVSTNHREAALAQRARPARPNVQSVRGPANTFRAQETI